MSKVSNSESKVFIVADLCEEDLDALEDNIKPYAEHEKPVRKEYASYSSR